MGIYTFKNLRRFNREQKISFLQVLLVQAQEMCFSCIQRKTPPKKFVIFWKKRFFEQFFK
jgi:hypothetical protein